MAVKQRLGLPVRFIGVGEGIDDLLPFTPEGFVEELLPREWKLHDPLTVPSAFLAARGRPSPRRRVSSGSLKRRRNQ